MTGFVVGVILIAAIILLISYLHTRNYERKHDTKRWNQWRQ